MRYRFSDARVHMTRPGPAEDAAGEVRILDGRTRVELASATIGGLAAEPTTVTVEPGEAAETGAVVSQHRGACPGSLPYWMENARWVR